MSLRTPTQYVNALKAEGCRVTGHPGWATVDRPGPWDPHGVIVHHTGPYASIAGIIDILRKGRPDLPGPLCHAGGRPDGIIDAIGWFDANHAGVGALNVLGAVMNDRATPAPGADAVDGNANFYGLELYHPGDGKTPWPPAQVDAAVRYCAAICRLHGWKATSVIFHKTWTTRKVDPRWSIALTTFQAKVTERLAHPASWSPPVFMPPPIVPPIAAPPPPPPLEPPPAALATIDGAIVKVVELGAYLDRLATGK